MELTIKEYLNINAPKYAEFKGYNEDFIKAVNDFTEGAEPTEQVLLFYDEAMETVKKFQEGGNIPSGVSSADREKNLRASWRQEVFSRLQLELYNKLKLGLEGKEGGITMDLFNDYQSRHANIYNRIKNTDFYTKAYRPETKGEVSGLQERYESHKFNDLAIKPNWETRYHINSSLPTSGDRIGQWVTDDLYSAITDDRRFGRDGDWEPDELEKFLNQLKELGYTYTLDKNDDYYKLGLLNPDASKNSLESPKVDTKTDLQSGIPKVETKPDLESGIPNISPKPSNFSYKVGEMFPDLFELSKFFNSIRTNKKIRDLALLHRPVTSEVVPEYSNIYGDLAALNQSYNDAANLLSKANRLGANTSDYRTASAINLLGYLQGEPLKALGRKLNNDRAMTTHESALSRVFKNNVEEQENANKNYANTVDNWNYGNDVRMAYENLKNINNKNFMDYWQTKIANKNQNYRLFMANMLESQMLKALENDPELLKSQKLYAEAKTQEEKDKAYNNFIEIKRRKSRELLPIYYQQLAQLKGFRYNPNDNPFMIYAKSGVKISDDGPVRTRSKDLERRRKSRKDARDSNDKKLDRLGRLMYLHAKGASSRK